MGGAVGAGAAAAPSPAGTRNQYVGPMCTGCGMMIGKDVRALQCDKCCKQDCWKCIDCLGITGEVYDMLIVWLGDEPAACRVACSLIANMAKSAMGAHACGCLLSTVGITLVFGRQTDPVLC